jgi:hypothetical protein
MQQAFARKDFSIFIEVETANISLSLVRAQVDTGFLSSSFIKQYQILVKFRD